jgi:NAD+ kinase
MKRIGVIANRLKPDAPAVLTRLAAKAGALDMRLLTTGDTAALLPGARVVPEDQLVNEIDALVALGGDGTMLRAVRSLGGADIPVVGVNLGSLGFMTSVPQENAERALDVLADGHYTTSARAIASCRVHRGSAAHEYRALNDIVLGWGASSRVVTIKLSIDNEEVTSYVCDGLILSTPTGSTGHSLSTGGPILHPETPAFVISVICPHALGHRPLVIPDQSRISVQIVEAPKKLLLSVDGQEEQPVEEGDRLEVARSPHSVRFFHLPGYSYFSVLRQKLHWSGSSR